MWVCEYGGGITLGEGEVEEGKERGFGEGCGVFLHEFFLVFFGGEGEKGIAIGYYACRLFGEGVVISDGFSQGLRDAWEVGEVALVMEFGGNAVDTVFVMVECIETELIRDQGKDEEGGRHAEGKAEDIDGGVGLIAQEGAPGDLEIILYHSVLRLFIGFVKEARSA